jgi:hypothetical protein
MSAGESFFDSGKELSPDELIRCSQKVRDALTPVTIPATFTPAELADIHDASLSEIQDKMDEVPEQLWEREQWNNIIDSNPANPPVDIESLSPPSVSATLTPAEMAVAHDASLSEAQDRMDKIPEQLWRQKQWNKIVNSNPANPPVDIGTDHEIRRSVALQVSHGTLIDACGVHPEIDSAFLECSECGYITPPHPEPAGKIFRLHVKSEHKRKMNAHEDGACYPFLSTDYMKLSRENQRPFKRR